MVENNKNTESDATNEYPFPECKVMGMHFNAGQGSRLYSPAKAITNYQSPNPATVVALVYEFSVDGQKVIGVADKTYPFGSAETLAEMKSGSYGDISATMDERNKSYDSNFLFAITKEDMEEFSPTTPRFSNQSAKFTEFALTQTAKAKKKKLERTLEAN